VAAELVRAGRSGEWVSDQTGIPAHALHEKLAMRLDFTIADLADIAHALEIPVAQLVPRLRDH